MPVPIGFSSMTFKQVLLSEKIRLRQLLRWGAENGFAWVELRDFELAFASDFLRATRIEGERLGLRIHYAWDGADIGGDGWSAAFERGVRNAALFGLGTCSRVVIAPGRVEPWGGYDPFVADWLIGRIRTAVRTAAAQGVTLVFENSLETLDGIGTLLDAVPEMTLTLDTANCFAASARAGEPLSWPELRSFVQRRRGQIPYVHLKSSVGGGVDTELLSNGDYPLRDLLPLLDVSAWLCIELPGDDDLGSVQGRLLRGRAAFKRALNG